MKKSKGEILQNTALRDALEHRKWTVEQGALYLGVPAATFKRWLTYSGKAPRISKGVAIRIWELTGKQAEDVLPAEFFIAQKAPHASLGLDKIPLHSLQGIIGSYYLFQDPEATIVQKQRMVPVMKALRDLSFPEFHSLRAITEGTSDFQLAEDLGVTEPEIRRMRSRAIDHIRKVVFKITGSIH